MPGLEVHLLGPVEATFDDRPLRLGATKQRVVLAILALHANTAVSAERLIEGLWGEDPPPSAAKLVQLYVSQLRRALVGVGAEIATHGRGYELRVPTEVVDAKRLEQLVDAAARSRTEAAGAREALALWRGGALADVAEEPFAAPEVRRLEELRLRATELAIDADLASGRHDDVVGELHRLVDEHPLRERFHAQRMLALYRSGRQAEALEAYQGARQFLVSEIGVEPGAELRALQHAILRQDPALDPPAAGAGAQARRADAADDGRPAAGSQAEPAMPNGSARSRVSASRRALIAAAGVVMVGGVLAFAVIRSSGPDRLPGIDENAVGRIDTSRSGAVAQYEVGRGAGTTAVGAGSVWTANTLDGTVSRIDLARHQVATIDVGDDVAGLAFGAGALWVAGGNRALTEVNPASNRVVRRIEFGNAPGSVAVGFHAVWVTVPVDGRVVRVDLASGRRRSIGVGADPAAIAVGDGAVWVAMQSVGTVVRIEPRSGAVVAAIGVGNQPSAIVVGHGAVWVANRQDNTVSRIDPATDAVTDLVPVGAEPGALAVATNGVWVGSEGDGSVARIDLLSHRTHDRIALHSAPRGMAAAGHDVWVAAGPLPGSHKGGTLRVRMDRLGVDPADAGYDPEGVPLVALVYDGLVAYRRVGGTAGNVLVGDLATSVPAPSAGGRAYVFTLRRGLRYADGTPVRAGDFRASMQRLLRAVGRDVPLYESIVGVTRCERDPKRCDLSRGIVADERARTITLHLTRADPNLIWNLAIPAASFVHPERPAPTGALPPVGTGPYRVSRFGQRRALLVRNPRFRTWSPDARPDGLADRVEVTVASGVKTQARAVALGAADVVPYNGGALAALPGVAAQYTSEVRSGDYPDMEFAFLNTRIPPFDHRDAREAINYATDRARLADLIGGRQIAAPTCQILPPGLPGHRPFCPFTVAPNPAGVWIAPDLAKARRLVTASGTRGQRVAIWASAERPAYGVYFAQLLQKLGYRPTLRRFPKLQALTEAAAKPTARPQLCLHAWIADFPDPANYVRQLLACASAAPSPPAGNLSRFCDPRLDAAVERAASTRGAAPIAAWRRIEQRIADASPIVPILNLRSAVLVSKRTGDVQFHPILGVLLDRIWVR